MAKDKKHKSEKASASKPSSKLKALAENPLVADVVAAALVATASALRDSNRARALASEAGEELGKLSKAGSEAGNAMWEMAMQIGRRSLEALQGEPEAPKKRKSNDSKSTAAKKAKKKDKKPAARTRAR